MLLVLALLLLLTSPSSLKGEESHHPAKLVSQSQTHLRVSDTAHHKRQQDLHKLQQLLHKQQVEAERDRDRDRDIPIYTSPPPYYLPSHSLSSSNSINTPLFNAPLSHDDALLRNSYPAKGGFFHVYDPYSNASSDPHCTAFYDQHDAAAGAFPQLVEDYKLWSGLVGKERMDRLTPNDTLFGMKYALDVIWKHQHPPDCSTAKFMIPTEHNGGFGSELHVFANALGIAMDLGRVYLSNPILQFESQWEIQSPFCTNQSGVHGFDCYYEPWSSCTIFDALGQNALQILKNNKIRKFVPTPTSLPIFKITVDHVPKMYSHKFLAEIQKYVGNSKSMLLHDIYRTGFKYIPRVFWDLVACSPIIPQLQYYWWRAISMTFVVRPNAKVMSWMEEHRMSTYEEAIKDNNVVSVYIRRGDKEREMRISPLSEYTDAMRLIWSLKYLPDKIPRVIFVASESSEAIEGMTEWVGNNSATYKLFYTNVFDRKGLYAEKSAIERDHGANRTHHPEEYLNMLLNIKYLLKGNAWVCTLGSNFCRVIDELRATVGARAGAPYADLSQEKCFQPPCIYGGIFNMDWR